jgi:hypothetical protein
MDTPEADVFAIQSGAMEPLPVYIEEETPLTDLQALIGSLKHPRTRSSPLDRDTVNAFIESQTMIQPGMKATGPPEPIMEYPGGRLYESPANEVMRIQQAIVIGLFDAISKGQEKAIAMLINNNLVTANTTNALKKTPLLAAIATKNVRVVEELLDFGAEVNAFGVEVFGFQTS